MIKKLSTLSGISDFPARSGLPADSNINNDDIFQISLSGNPGYPYSSTGWATGSVSFEELALNMATAIENPLDLRTITLSSDTNPVEGDTAVPAGNITEHILTIKTVGDALTLSGSADGSTVILSGTDKYAIVPSVDGDFVSLVCAEMPETRFEDVINITVGDYDKFTHVIDNEFVFVCEEGTIDVISCVANTPAILGCEIIDGVIDSTISVDMIPQEGFPRPTNITVKISGIRKGRLGKRFIKWTAEQAQQNTEFWNSWNT